jgi:uncharacterized protein
MSIRQLHTAIAKTVLLLGSVLCIACFTASAIPQRPEPARLVNDLAGIFSAEQISHLERELVAFDDSTSNQIAVVTVNDLEGYDAASYATKIGLDWGVGSAEFNNGIVILVKPKDTSSGQVFIAVGYGLEGAIPDAYAKRIINNEMIPHFMENDYFGGVYAACGTLMKLASGEISVMREYEEDEDIEAYIILTLFIIMLILFVVASSSKNGGNNGGGNGGRRVHTRPIITIGDDFGSWGPSRGGSFGGGFGGGFGGFGGGSFGGGGAGGSW